MNEYILFLVQVPILLILSVLADKTNKKIFVWLMVIILSLIAGLRAPTVGFDTISYYSKFELINEGLFEYAYGLETSFKYFTYFLQRIFDNFTFYLLFLAFLTNSLIMFRLWSLRKISVFPIMVLCYYAAFYQMTMNGMRQFLAVAFVFYGTKYIKERRIYTFLLFVLLGMIFHRSAFIGGIYLLSEFFNWKNLKVHEKVLMIMILAIIPISLFWLQPYLVYYSRFFNNIIVNYGIMIPIKICFFIFSMILLKTSRKKTIFDSFDYKQSEALISYFYLLGIILSFLGYNFEFLERVAWYFYLFEGVYFGLVLKRLGIINKFFVGSFILLMMGYIFMYSLTNNSQGILPYLTF